MGLDLWYGRSEQLAIFRRLYQDAKSVLVTGAEKELAYLMNAPKGARSSHDDDALGTFCIFHPVLTDSNVKVSKDFRGLRILSVLDWQHTIVRPFFLLAGMPDVIPNEADAVSRSMVKLTLPSAFDRSSKEDQKWEMELLCRLVHSHYNLSTAAYNGIHHNGLVYPLKPLHHRIFIHATAAWEGETIELRCALVDMVLDWASSVQDDAPCPVVFTEDEKAASEKLYPQKNERMLRDYVGYVEDVAHHEEAKTFSQEMKRITLKACAQDEETTEEAYAMIEANWPLDDVDEKPELEEFK